MKLVNARDLSISTNGRYPLQFFVRPFFIRLAENGKKERHGETAFFGLVHVIPFLPGESDSCIKRLGLGKDRRNHMMSPPFLHLPSVPSSPRKSGFLEIDFSPTLSVRPYYYSRRAALWTLPWTLVEWLRT
jgi:hypothetical protein